MAEEKDINALINAKDSFIDDSELALLNDFDSIEAAIYRAVMKKVMSMNQKNGKLVFDPANIMTINEINSIVVAAIQSSKYPSNVKSYLRNFDQVRDYNARIQNKVNGITFEELETLINPVQSAMIDKVMQDLTGQGIDVEFIRPLTEGIYRNIVSGATISDLQQSLEQVIKSNPERLGSFKRYVVRMSRDAMLQYDGQINSRIANEYGLDAYIYVGTIIRDTRPQCIRWLGKKILKKSELDSEIAWAYNYGTGGIPGTTADNFAIYRGGYNCRHTAVPVKLTASVKKQFGID
jgi:hypothetical protein